jgi:hypothetical protein
MAPSGFSLNPTQLQQLAATASALVHAPSFTDAAFTNVDLSSIIRIHNHDQVVPMIAELTAQVEAFSNHALTVRRLDHRLVHGSVDDGIKLVLLPLACAQQPGLLPISCRSAHFFRIVRARPYVRMLQKANWAELRERFGQKNVAVIRQARCSCV